MSEIVKASSAEWEVMRVIWSLEKATSRSVSEVLKETQDWEVATTKTLLGRLVKKGYLETSKKGNHFIYTPTISESDSVDKRVNRLFSSICQAGIGQAIANAIDDFDLTNDDYEMIQKVLNEKEYVDHLHCDCLSKGGSCNCEEGKCNCSK